MKYEIIISILIFLSVLAYSSVRTDSKIHNEKYYQTKLCAELDGVIEYRLIDKTRVDCLTNEYAIEVDFAKKWAESIGQSLFYAEMTGREPAVGLIISKKDKRFLKRLNLVARKLSIKIFILKKEEE